MLTPTLFFLVVVNFVYGFFETFAVVDATTRGGPAGATTILVYKVYLDGSSRSISARPPHNQSY